MYDKIIIQDSFGRYYTIQSHIHPWIKGTLKPKEFSTHHMAHQFVQDLLVPPGYWQGLMQDITSVDNKMMNGDDVVNAACECIITGQIKIFAVNPPKPASGSHGKSTIETRDKVYHFVPAVEQLLNKTDTKTFNNVQDAKTFLDGLNPDEEQLKDMASQLNIDMPITANPSELSQAITESLVTGDTVVMVDLITSSTPPKPMELPLAGPGNAKADLGPHATDSTENILKDIDIQLYDEFEQMLGSHRSLLNGMAFILKTDMGEEHEGTVDNGRIFVSKAQFDSSFELKIKDLPLYLEA